MDSQISTGRSSGVLYVSRFFKTVMFSATMFVAAGLCRAQETNPALNSVFVELGGTGVLYSLNYERLFIESAGARVGLMYLSTAGGGPQPGSISVTIVPLLATYLVGNGSHKIEAGAGADFVSVSGSANQIANFAGLSFQQSAVLGTFVIGYRYQLAAGGFLFRATFTPSFGWQKVMAIKGDFLPWAGLSFGYAF